MITNLDNLTTAERVSVTRQDPRGESLVPNSGGPGEHIQDFVPRSGFTEDDVYEELTTILQTEGWTIVDGSGWPLCAETDGLLLDGTATINTFYGVTFDSGDETRIGLVFGGRC